MYCHGLNDSCVSINATDSRTRSLELFTVVIGSKIGAIAGQQFFQLSDKPRYTRAFLTFLLLQSASFPVEIVLMWVYWRDNRTERNTATPGAAKKRRVDL